MVGTRSTRKDDVMSTSEGEEAVGEDSFPERLTAASPSRRSARLNNNNNSRESDPNDRVTRQERRRQTTELDVLMGRDQAALRAGWPVRHLESSDDEEEDTPGRDTWSGTANSNGSRTSVRNSMGNGVGNGQSKRKGYTKYALKSLAKSGGMKEDPQRGGGEANGGSNAGRKGVNGGAEEESHGYSFRDRTNLKQPEILTYIRVS
ncbi:unnamed protein product [Discosporangium mesarthrocarpum]